MTNESDWDLSDQTAEGNAQMEDTTILEAKLPAPFAAVVFVGDEQVGTSPVYSNASDGVWWVNVPAGTCTEFYFAESTGLKSPYVFCVPEDAGRGPYYPKPEAVVDGG